MSHSVAVIWDDSLSSYDFGVGHPMAPLRVRLAMDLARALGLLDLPNVTVVGLEPASDELLLTVHDRRYLSEVRGCSEDPYAVHPSSGLGTSDNPAFLGMHQASALVVGATVEAARQVWSGTAAHSVSLSGGMHHAMPDHAAGFCIYNDLAVAIQWLLDNGAKRVAYVDVDAHHGDGVEAVFWDDPRVLTVSLHESGEALFPGTGWPHDVGGDAAPGTAVNVALPSGTNDEQWMRAFEAVVPGVLERFAPEVIVSQHGCDSHRRDPLARLELTIDGQRAAYARIHELAHAVSGGRWIATGGGGYDVMNVVPRAWAHTIAEASGNPLKAGTPVPEAWRAEVERLTGRPAPESMSDEDEPEEIVELVTDDLDREVDRAITRTISAVFPL